MKISNLDTIEFISFNLIFLYLFIYCIYSIAWLFLGYGIIKVVQKMLLKGVDLIKNSLPYLLAIQNLDLIQSHNTARESMPSQ